MENYEEYKKSYLPDKRDSKILNVICDNAKMSYSEIGKLTLISKDRIRERIKRLEKEKFILSYIPLINYKGLGYSLFYLYIKLDNFLGDFKDFMKDLMEQEEIISLTRVIGLYDLEIKVIVKNKADIVKWIKNLKRDNIKRISKIKILSSKSLDFFSMRVQGNALKNKISSGIKELKSVNIDDKDKLILKILAKNARESFVNISKATKIKVESIRYKIKSLIKKGVILGFYARTNKHRLGLNSYILLLKLKKELSEKEKSKLKNMPNVYYLERTKGSFNMIIQFYAKGNGQLLKTVDAFRNDLNEQLSDFCLLILLERYKSVPF